MAKYVLPPFGEIDTENLDSFYEAFITLEDFRMNLELNFEESTLEVGCLNEVKQFLGHILDFEKRNKEYLKNDFSDSRFDAVKPYIEHHLEEIGPEQLKDLVDVNNKSSTLENQLLNSLKPIRISFYPGNESQFAVFDYSIGEDYTQYVIALMVDQNGNLQDIAMES